MSSSAILTLPNLITLLRIGAIPLFLSLLADERYSEALLVFVLAGVTDSIDGAVARWTNSRSVFGAYIDPLADKLLLASSFLILAFLGFLPRWLAILVISRAVITLCGFAVLYRITGHWIAVRPTLMGKASTFLQLLTVTLTLIVLHNPAWEVPYLKPTALALTAGTVAISGFQYLTRALVWLNEHDEQPENEWVSGDDRAQDAHETNRQRYSA